MNNINRKNRLLFSLNAYIFTHILDKDELFCRNLVISWINTFLKGLSFLENFKIRTFFLHQNMPRKTCYKSSKAFYMCFLIVFKKFEKM